MTAERIIPNPEEEFVFLINLFLEEFSCAQQPQQVVIVWSENGHLKKILPEVEALKDVPQRADYHLEGDVWTHTLQALAKLPQGIQAAQQLPISPTTHDTLTLRLAVLFHDIGKATTTDISPDGLISSHLHPEEGALIASQIFNRWQSLNLPFKIDEERIIWLIKYHLVGQGSDETPLRKANIRKYFLRPDGWGADLFALNTADTLGRESISEKSKTARLDTTADRIIDIHAEDMRGPIPLPPIPDGKRIMELSGLPPSLAIGQIKRTLLSLQQQLEFTCNEKGEEVACFFLRQLSLSPDNREITPGKLEQAAKKTLSHFLRENSRIRLGEEVVSVFAAEEEIPWLRKEVRGKWQEYSLHRAEARQLENRQVRIIILGPPRSGKTSFVDSLSRYLAQLRTNCLLTSPCSLLI